MKPMTIFALDQGEHLGGAERFFSDLMTRLSETHEVHLITGMNAAYHRLYLDSKVQLMSTNLPALKPIGLRSLRSLIHMRKKLKGHLRQIKPDVIVSNTVRTHIIVSPLAKELGIPLVWMGNDLTFPKLLLRWFSRYPNAIISCSRFTQQYYQSNGRNESIQFQVLYPYGVSPESLEQLIKIPKERLVGMIGKFIPWKGQDLFIEMAERLHHKYPDIRFRLMGDAYQDNPESLSFFKECQEQIRSKGLSKVLEVGPSESVLEDIARWEVLVHCSREPEPLGRVILEGMTSGCAVLASKLGGPAEIVQHDNTGILVEPELEELTAAVERLLENKKERQSLQKKGRASIQEQYSWEKVLERFEGVLRSS